MKYMKYTAPFLCLFLFKPAYACQATQLFDLQNLSAAAFKRAVSREQMGDALGSCQAAQIYLDTLAQTTDFIAQCGTSTQLFNAETAMEDAKTLVGTKFCAN